MRKILVSCAVFICAIALHGPAHAQSLGDMLSVMSRGQNTLSRINNDPCQWQKGIAATLCQTQRAMSIADQVGQTRKAYDDARRRSATRMDLRDPRPDLTMQLSQLCSAGDEIACDTVRRWRAKGGQNIPIQTASAAIPQTEAEKRATMAYQAALNAQRPRR